MRCIRVRSNLKMSFLYGWVQWIILCCFDPLEPIFTFVKSSAFEVNIKCDCDLWDSDGTFLNVLPNSCTAYYGGLNTPPKCQVLSYPQSGVSLPAVRARRWKHKGHSVRLCSREFVQRYVRCDFRHLRSENFKMSKVYCLVSTNIQRLGWECSYPEREVD
jgi:hypothetical protein